MPAAPAFRYRLGLNQPAHSPTARRMAEMAAAVNAETAGVFHLDVFPESRLGPDPQMFADVRSGALDFFVSGATLGGVAPSSSLPMLPFAFKDSASVFAALDGELGDIIRRELRQNGLHAFPRSMQNGFHHITTANRPIRTADDFAGLKIRSPGGAFAGDFFRTLGAEAGMVPFSGLYEALKAGTFDAQSDPLGVVLSLKLYEVQTCLTLTGHWWSGFTLLANMARWQALPGEVREAVERHAAHFALLQRQDTEAINAAGAEQLLRHGMVVNTADTDSFKARLGPFYASWRPRFDLAAWRALEAHAGPVGG
ncbi:MAG TPA: TRAP transporter substrate-binding protein [Stellaceae bacterium]|nr:TRAP transporter substrate-binding protein [Stellaceae bacterium]